MFYTNWLYDQNVFLGFVYTCYGGGWLSVMLSSETNLNSAWGQIYLGLILKKQKQTKH